MKLDKNSLHNILTHNKVVVYGLSSCRYDDVGYALSDLNYSVKTALNYNFERLHFSGSASLDGNFLSDLCKNTISSLVYYNYKQFKENKPVIPLVFCIEYESYNEKNKLDISDVAKTESSYHSMTNKELRRCYKVSAETDPKIKMIADMTFKFVKVKQLSAKSDLCALEELPPFWKNNSFIEGWKKRIANPNRQSQINAKNNPKRYKWKDELTSKIKLFDNIESNNSATITSYAIIDISKNSNF